MRSVTPGSLRVRLYRPVMNTLPSDVGFSSSAVRWLITAPGESSPTTSQRFRRMTLSGGSFTRVVYRHGAIFLSRPRAPSRQHRDDSPRVHGTTSRTGAHLFSTPRT